MSNRPLLEICVETLEAALAAMRGGADRLELCENLLVGGVTPSMELMRAVRAQIKLPVFAMIRTRGGDFVPTQPEFEQMIRDLATVKACGMDGVVLGMLHSERNVEVEGTKKLVELARPLPVTFHRAFDETPDLLQALDDVIASGAARILTSGGKPNAKEGSSRIAELVKRAGGRIEILAGGGINSATVEWVMRKSGAREFHAGLSSRLPYPQTDFAAFESEVRKLSEALERQIRPKMATVKSRGIPKL
jgi:copper homeostasis protein